MKILTRTPIPSLRRSKSDRLLVVWNPGPDHGLGDLTPDGWRAFVCVEAARIEGAEPLPAGATWTGTQTFRSGG